MNPEKTHLYKKQYQQPIEEETPPKKGKSKTAATSDSRKRSKHKHIYTGMLAAVPEYGLRTGNGISGLPRCLPRHRGFHQIHRFPAGRTARQHTLELVWNLFSTCSGKIITMEE